MSSTMLVIQTVLVEFLLELFSMNHFAHILQYFSFFSSFFESLESLITATIAHWTLCGFYADLLKCFGVLHSYSFIVNLVNWLPINSLNSMMNYTSAIGTCFRWN